MKRMSWLFASVLLWGCHSGVAPGAIRLDVLLPSALKADCIEVAAQPASGGETFTTDPIPRQGRNRLTVAVYPGKSLQGAVLLSAEAFADASCSGTPIEKRQADAPVSFDPAKVTPAEVDLWALSFSSQPSTTTADGLLGAEVKVLGGSDQVVSDATGKVSLALRGGPAGASLAGAAPTPLSSGVARFTGLSVHRSGGGYRLQATLSGMPPALSDPFDVGAGVSASLAFVDQPPPDAGAGIPWQVSVRVSDAFGNLTGFGTAVQVGLADAGVVPLLGTTTAVVDGGMATYTGLSVQVASAGYRLRADATGIPEAVSNPFVISPGPPAKPPESSLAIAPDLLPADGTTPAALTVQLRDAYGNVVPGARVTLGTQGTRNVFVPASGSGLTDSGGRFSATVTSTKVQREQISADIGSFIMMGNLTFELPPCRNLTFVDGGTLMAFATDSPIDLATGDLDGDGRADLILADEDAGLTIFPREGDGGFGAPEAVATGAAPQAVWVGDLDGDGRDDLVASERTANQVEVFRGSADGGLEARTGYPVGKQPIGLAASDLDGDGRVDLAVANFKDNTVSVLRGQADGGFGNGPVPKTGLQPVQLVVGDFNQDGQGDLAVVDFGASLSVLLNQGSTFGAPATYVTGSQPGDIAVGVFDQSPGLDLAVADNGAAGVGGGITLLSGEPDGGFTSGPTLSASLSFGRVEAGDLDSNGSTDLVAVQTGADQVSVFLQDAGTFETPLSWPTGTQPSAVGILDVNGDGRPDLLVANQSDDTVTVLLNTCTP